MQDSAAAAVTQAVQTGPMTTLRPVGATMKVDGIVDQRGIARLVGVSVQDYDNQKAAITVLFFSADLATEAVDNTAWTMASADMPNCLGKVEILTTDYTTVGGKAVATKNLTQPMVMKSTTQKIYAVALVTGTPTYASGTVGFVFHSLRD